MQDNRKRPRALEHISSITKGVLEFTKHSLAEDSKLILCFICSLGTGIGLAISVTCVIGENAPLGLPCLGLIISAISFAVFLYIAWKMD
jgi:hypothetical protein